MLYQWGRKDSFTFASNSLLWGTAWQVGKYPVKIYTIDGVLIYQEELGLDNTDKQPAGGIIQSSNSATSMMEIIKNPITFYVSSEVISQVGHGRSLRDYYWTSYSRGTDGLSNWNTALVNQLNNHNKYLDGYQVMKSKSIYDPCPFGFRIHSNGTWNQVGIQPWVENSYTSGFTWIFGSMTSWIGVGGYRSSYFYRVGSQIGYFSATVSSKGESYLVSPILSALLYNACSNSLGYSVRCIEDLSLM